MRKAAVIVSVATLLAGCASNNLPELPPAPPTANVSSPDISERTLKVGPDEIYKQPSAAAAVAFRGDTIVIDAGHYADCSVWNADDLTIRADGDVVIDGPVCDNKGLFVIHGRNATIRGITFRGAVSTAGNGAGIRGQADTLTVENSKFIGNQNGILATGNKNAVVTIRDSVFEDNGTCIAGPRACAHGVYIGADLLRIENSIFRHQHVGHNIKSRSARTELIGNTIEDGPDGTSSYLVDVPDGGSLVMRNNILEKGAKTQNVSCAITVGEESARHPTTEILLENNRVTNDFAAPVIFLCNRTATSPQLDGNTLRGRLVPVGVPDNS